TASPTHDPGDRHEREQRRGRVAPRVRDQASRGRSELGQRVAPVLREAMRPGEIDDYRAFRRVEVVVEAAEDESGPGRERLLIRDELRKRSVPVPGEPRVERLGRFARQRNGAEREQLERGVREHAVERLLPGETARADDSRRNHMEYYADLTDLCNYPVLASSASSAALPPVPSCSSS